MVAAHICGSCRGIELPGGLGKAEPRHCYGRSDRPAPPGVLGGYRCSCPCRNESAEHAADCPYEGKLTLDNIHKSWGLGWVCLGCARPVTITVEHYR